MIICFILAWMLTNGWSYVFIAIGFIFNIEWMSTIGLSYQAFLWLPCTPEKLVTIPLAIWFDKLIFKGKHVSALKSKLAKVRDLVRRRKSSSEETYSEEISEEEK